MTSVLKHVWPLWTGRHLEEVGGAPATPAPSLAIPEFDFQPLDPNWSLSRSNFDYETLPGPMALAGVLTDPPRIDARTVPERLHRDYRCQEPHRSEHPSTGYGERIDSGGNHIGNLTGEVLAWRHAMPRVS